MRALLLLTALTLEASPAAFEALRNGDMDARSTRA